MSPIYSYLCADCGFEFDTIGSVDGASRRMNCERCETGQAHRVPTVCAPARGSFGTVRRDTTKEKPQTFNFPKKGE